MTEAKRFYHINYVVIQGFPALRKAVTTHVKKYDIFSQVFDIANQLTRPSRLAPFGQVDEWTAKPSSFSIRGRLSNFFGLWLLKHWKIPIAYKKYDKKNWKLRIQWLWKWHFLWLRTKIDNSKICYRPILAVYILSVRTNSKTENFLHWKTMPIVCLGSDSTHVFILSAPKYFTIFIRGLSILLFSLMN